MRIQPLALLAACALGGCSGMDRTRDAGASGSPWITGLRGDPVEFPLSGRREVKVVYSLVNSSRETRRLDFPTAQRLEVTMRGADGGNLFQWSEDRHFAAVGSSVVVNPGERLEYEVAVPTRDMVAGRAYPVEAVLPGHPETAASIELRPR